MSGTTFSNAPSERITAANGIDYAYRDIGDGSIPLVLLQHFRGNLDNWDPALVDELAASRRVVTFDNVGVGGTSGSTHRSIGEMARGAIDFIDAMGFESVDLLGFSIGSFVAQEIVLSSPGSIRQVILASSAPRGAAGMHGWAADVIGAVGGRDTGAEEYLSVFFAPSEASQQAGKEALGRMYARQEDRDTQTSWETRVNQYEAVCDWGIPDHGLLQRVAAIDKPVFIANGDNDPMILPHYSYLLAGLIPGSSIKIYEDSAHGFLFQHYSQFSADVNQFLDR
jgi:pimeloyl-ACP methyl ester carboxylesterase